MINDFLWHKIKAEKPSQLFLADFGILKAFDFIERFHLKPNDAIILATCKYYEMDILLSLDDDFLEPCKKLGLLINKSTVT